MTLSDNLKRYLTLNVVVQKIVAGRCGLLDMEHEEFEPEEIAYVEKIVSNGKNPKKWKRMRKYKIDSPANEIYVRWDKQKEKHIPEPELTGCTVREFYLEDTDHVTIALITNDEGEVIMMDDLSD